MSDQRGHAGGAAMGAGGDYQARIAALLAVYALAEEDAQPPFSLTDSINAIACEVGDPVDDLAIQTVGGHSAAIQAKRTVSLNRVRSGADGSLTPFASAIDQFVRQYHLAKARSHSGEAAELDPGHDRLVLAVGATAPATISQALARALDRIRIQPAGEPLLAAVLNRHEREAVEALIEHARASWAEETGSAPSDADLHDFLQLVRVETVAIERGETDEGRALDLLRQSVVRDPSDARHAWNVLLEIGSRLIATRSGIAVAQLRSALEEEGIPLRGARSYREDIERLRGHTVAVLAQLREHSTVPLGSDRIRIDRPHSSALRAAAEDGSVLVVGEPGIGKSGALYELAHGLGADGRTVVMLTAQDPPFASMAQLQDALRLEHDLADVLANWPGAEPAFLVVDALDAARTESSAQALRQVIDRVQRACPRWRIVASVREWDARYGRELQRLFQGAIPPGPSSPLPGPAFARTRHLVVGELTDAELDQLASVAPRLDALVKTAPPTLSRLFRTPFNLRLAGELLDAGTEPEAIREVRSQLELLDLYWSERVLGAGDSRNAHAREAVLVKAVRTMVQRRSLRADTSTVAEDPAASSPLADLLSSHVLIEWRSAADSAADRYSLTFAHHVLFDYAVKRLVLPRDPARLAEYLASDSAFVLLARPSLVMHFHERWSVGPAAGRREFWDIVLAVAGAAGIPEVGKLVGPSIAAELMKEVAELDPLMAGLESADESARAAAENAFYHLVRSVPLPGESPSQFPADQIAPWCTILERVSRNYTDGTAYPSRTLLLGLSAHAEHLDADERSELGAASRRLLEYAWAREPRDRNLVVHALQLVCRTFASDSTASATLLRRAVATDHLAAFGSEELRWVASETEHLAKLDPHLVRDVYSAAFGYSEESDEPTPMGGIVMPLTSNRRQDYHGALYGFRRAFPAFLAAAPDQAVMAMNDALEAYVARKRLPDEVAEEEYFDFHGRRVSIRTDHSQVWDRGHARPGDYAVELLDEMESRIAELAGSEGGDEELQRHVAILIRESRLAVVWRRLLRLGARHPETLGVILRPLLWAEPILTGTDTSSAAGQLIQATAVHLAVEDRERIEHAIMGIPETDGGSRRRWKEQTRDRLLGCFGDLEPVTEAARERLAHLRAENTVPTNADDRPLFQMYSKAFGETEYLAEQGVPVDEGQNRRIRDLEAPVNAFAAEHINSIPDSAAVLRILPDLRALHGTLETADADGVHPRQAAHAWGTLADACAAVAGSSDLHSAPPAEAFARDVLLTASHHPDPLLSADEDSQFIVPHWGKPAARIDSAEGLMALSARSSDLDEEVSDALDRLATDAVPAVRYQLAIRLHWLYREAPDRCWAMLAKLVGSEWSPGVALGLLQGPLYGLQFLAEDRVVALTRVLYNRFAAGPGSKEVRNECVSILANLHVMRGHREAGLVIREIPTHLLDHLDEAARLVAEFREALVLGPAEGKDPSLDDARERAVDFVLAVTREAARLFQSGVTAASASQPKLRDGAPGAEQMEALAHILDAVATNIYFVSGAYEDSEQDGPDPAVQARLLREVGAILDELAEVGMAPIAHHLLETLEAFIPHDPKGVFRRVVAVIRGGTKGNYQYDRMAEEVLVRMIERFLADHRSLFQEDEQARTGLLDILDTFVRAGSEGARRLSYGLDGVFR